MTEVIVKDTTEEFARLANAVSDAIHGAFGRGVAADDACSVAATVVADYARGNYGDEYLFGLVKVMLARAGAPFPGDPDSESSISWKEEKALACRKLDTQTHVLFYEQEFYVLSNFSAFSLQWKGMRFDTSEAAYHYEKFTNYWGCSAPEYAASEDVAANILIAPSAHEAFKIAERAKALRRPDWDDIKVNVMSCILQAKADQHEYVRRKLLETGDRVLIEDSWRDDFWGWGPNRDGQNMLGKLWMEIRAELRAKEPAHG